MATFPGLYRAKAVKLDTTSVTAQIPQVYGDASVTITDFIGGMPTSVGMGWVTFRSGDPAFPVWHGETGGSGGDGGGDPSPDIPALSYVHNQATPAATWTINHSLSFYPNVTVVDSAGDTAEGNIAYPLLTRVVLTFSAAFSGTAYLS